MEKIKVIIAEGSEAMMQYLCEILSKDDEIEVAAAAKNEEEAYRKIKEHKPDIVLLNLAIPRQKGLLMMERIQKDEELFQSPKFIVISAEKEDETIQDVFRLGADFYMMKPLNEEVLRKRIHYISQKKDWKTRQRDWEDVKKQQGKLRKWTMEEDVGRLVYAMGIQPHVKGYFYLRDAIIMAVRNAGMLDKVNKRVYMSVANMHETSSVCVERAIRHAVDVAWTRDGIRNIKRIWGQNIGNIGTEGEKPESAELIAVLADKIRLKYGSKEDGI